MNKRYSDDHEVDVFCQELLRSVKEMQNGEATRKTEVQVLDVASIRQKTGLSQRNFALLLGVSFRTLQAWEQGVRTPSGAARTLLIIVEKNPKILADLHQ